MRLSVNARDHRRQPRRVPLTASGEGSTTNVSRRAKARRSRPIPVPAQTRGPGSLHLRPEFGGKPMSKAPPPRRRRTPGSGLATRTRGLPRCRTVDPARTLCHSWQRDDADAELRGRRRTQREPIIRENPAMMRRRNAMARTTTTIAPIHRASSEPSPPSGETPNRFSIKSTGQLLGLIEPISTWRDAFANGP